MLKTIKALPFSVEFAIVLLIGFGYFSYLSLEWFVYYFNPTVNYPSVIVSNNDVLGLLKIELLSFLLIVGFLWIRGWSIASLNIKANFKLTFYGFVLYIGNCLCSIFTFSLFVAFLGPAVFSVGYPLDYSELDRSIVLLSSLINPFFEEILVTGYIIQFLRYRKGFWFAVHASTFVRLLYHLYMGPMVIIFILPMGILFAYTYARWGKLWPLIFAHMVANIIGFTIAGSSI
jgi:membrane protease YdiL (CAAX protease family)